MKVLLNNSIAFFVLLSMVGCRKDDHSISACCAYEISDESTDRFKLSAYAFAYEEIKATSGFTNHKIDESIYNCYLGKLSAIYNKIQESDSSYYKLIHNTHVYKKASVGLRDFVIRFSTSALKEQFLNDFQSIENDFLKYIINDLNFNTYPYEWDSLEVGLYAEEFYNIPFIIDRLTQYPDIDSAYSLARPVPDDFNKIELKKIGDVSQFQFSYGVLDGRGEPHFHYWTINVTNDCQVELVNSYGDDIF
ncbi:hypothetical protein [Crocinitomix catalasitica]|uniref:hypothetical protein n=1 Tax=Crocinitomix catalasitica TaxID=184607 RepID=UPI000484615E|nr:hypothetical protein [Crocinitomix catalasitica]